MVAVAQEAEGQGPEAVVVMVDDAGERLVVAPAGPGDNEAFDLAHT